MALQEAQAIFGDADELLEQFRAATARSGQQPEASDEEGDDGLDEADLAADEDAQAERLRTTVGSCISALAISLPLPVSASWPAWWALCHALHRTAFQHRPCNFRARSHVCSTCMSRGIGCYTQ